MTSRHDTGTTPDAGTDPDAPRGNRVRLVRSGELDGHAAISGCTVGSKRLWTGRAENPPLSSTDNHHHGASGTGIHVVSGHPVFIHHDGEQEVRIAAHPGDFVLVPPFVPHREENPGPDEPAVVVLARTAQEPIKVSVPELYRDEETGPR